jgi:imidazolonepropionase-like amidohydrolase
VAEQLGSIESGKVANLVVARGEPLADGTQLHMVFVDGIRHDVTPSTPRNGNAQQRRGQ